MPALEADYKPKLHSKIYKLFPGCVILKNDSEFCQGIPDTLVLFLGKWAMLEVKRERPASGKVFRPNQIYWIELLNEMSYAACVYPENEEDVLNDLQQLFSCGGETRHVDSEQPVVAELRRGETSSDLLHGSPSRARYKAARIREDGDRAGAQAA